MSEEEVVESTEEVVEETPAEESSEQVAFVDNMLSQIDNEDIKSAGFWKNLEGKNANEVGQYIKELQSFAGKKGDIPKSDATEEEWSEFYQKLGRPENIEGYDFEIGDEFVEIVGEDSIPFFNSIVEGFKEKVFSMGANAEQAEELTNWYLETVANQITSSNADVEDYNKSLDEDLRNQWGDEYNGMLMGIENLLTANGMPEENVGYLKESGVLKEPTFANALAKIASKFADDPEIGHHQTKTVAGLQDQLADVNMDIAEYIKSGTKIPQHVAQKRQDLMNKLGDNL